jgi:polyhydroxybutyrate depolymerase
LLTSELASGAFVPGTNVRSIEHDGRSRFYNVYVPADYGGTEALPLVVDLHGFTSTKEQQQVLSGWQEKADLEGFFVAFPDGFQTSWNAGVCCGAAISNRVDDVGFIVAMVAAIGVEGSLDMGSIYATGLSNGGAMTHRLACEATDTFTAAAPIAFPVPYTDFNSECTPPRSIPILLFMGLTDTVIPYVNGPFGDAVESFNAWREKQVCGVEPPEEQLSLGGSSCSFDRSCAAGASQVGLCSVRGSAFHPFPVPISSGFVDGHILYLNDDDVVLPDLIWDFFQSQRLGSRPASGNAIDSIFQLLLLQD